jgi:glycosyltransferase involved in cell wall biosynthesis
MIRRISDEKLFVYEEGRVYSAEKVIESAKKYTIAVLIDTAIAIPPTTGVTYRLYYLSKTLIERGHKIIWILGNRNFSSEKSLSDLLEVGIKIHVLPSELFYDSAYISLILKKDDVDVVQYEITQTFVELGVQIRVLTKLPVLLELHDIEATLRDTLGRGEESPLMKFLQYIAGECADSIIAMTPLDYKTLIEKIGVQKEKLFLVPNGVSLDKLDVSVNKSENTLLFLGNLFYPPNQNAFIYIADELLPELGKNRKVILKSIGMIPDRLKEKYSNREDVTILGEVKDKQKFSEELSSSTVGLCTVFAGSGMKTKILDYCSVGLPVVSTSIGASGYEEVESLIIADNKEEILDSINLLFEDIKKAEEIGKQNQKRIMGLYSWRKIAERFEEALFLAASFNSSRFNQENLKPFWLEEKRHNTEVLKDHFVIEHQTIKKYEQ